LANLLSNIVNSCWQWTVKMYCLLFVTWSSLRSMCASLFLRICSASCYFVRRDDDKCYFLLELVALSFNYYSLESAFTLEFSDDIEDSECDRLSYLDRLLAERAFRSFLKCGFVNISIVVGRTSVLMMLASKC